MQMISYFKNFTLIDQLFMILKIFGSFLLGGAIGWEREKVGKEAGIRTFGFICAGSCAFSILSTSLYFADPSRVVSMIVTGISFIGGGIIFRIQNIDKTPHGLTTSSSLWVTATIGVMVGFELYVVAIAVALFIVIALHLPSSKLWLILSKKHKLE